VKKSDKKRRPGVKERHVLTVKASLKARDKKIGGGKGTSGAEQKERLELSETGGPTVVRKGNQCPKWLMENYKNGTRKCWRAEQLARTVPGRGTRLHMAQVL